MAKKKVIGLGSIVGGVLKTRFRKKNILEKKYSSTEAISPRSESDNLQTNKYKDQTEERKKSLSPRSESDPLKYSSGEHSVRYQVLEKDGIKPEEISVGELTDSVNSTDGWIIPDSTNHQVVGDTQYTAED